MHELSLTLQFMKVFVGAGATASSYNLGGYSASAFTSPAQLNYTNITASGDNGQLSATFTLTLPSSQVCVCLSLCVCTCVCGGEDGMLVRARVCGCAC